MHAHKRPLPPLPPPLTPNLPTPPQHKPFTLTRIISHARVVLKVYTALV